jgi:hypothetical protein
MADIRTVLSLDRTHKLRHHFLAAGVLTTASRRVSL